jgi:uncharacterized repeat protein (TIGR01451 family)
MGPGPDVTISKSGSPDPAIAGESMTWTVELENEGAGAATGLEFEDPQPDGQTFTALAAPAGWDCGSFDPGDDVSCTKANMAPGETATFTITAAIAPDYMLEDICNTATITHSEASASAEDCAAVEREADLALEKQGPAEAIAGEEVEYTIVVTNNGPSAVSEFTISDDISTVQSFGTPTFDPAVDSSTCAQVLLNFGCDIVLTLQPGESLTMTLPVTFPPDTEEDSEQTNTAEVSSDATDPNLENNDDAVTTTIFWEADLEVVKEVEFDDEQILIGFAITHFDIRVINHGPSNARNVVLTDVLPPGFEDWFFHETPPDWTCEEEDGTIVCERDGTMPPGDELFNIHLDFTFGTPNGDLTNTASVESVNSAPEGEESSATPDPDPTNNSDSATVRYITPLLFTVGPTSTTTIPAYEANPALNVADEDIVLFDGFEFSVLWDGSDVGVTAPLDAFTFLQPDFFFFPFGARGEVKELFPPVLISFSQNMTIPAASTVGGTKLVVADHDIVIFYPDQLGSTTEGLFDVFFDASDILLNTTLEDIDAIEVDAQLFSSDRGFFFDNINLYISTAGSFSVLGGLTGQDEDVMVCRDLQWGSDTVCDDGIETAVDGSDIDLGADSEDVNGLTMSFSQAFSCDAARGLCADRGDFFDVDLMVTTRGNFSVNQPDDEIFPQVLNGANEDVLLCLDADLGPDSGCDLFAIYFDGSDFGLATKELTNIEWDFQFFVDAFCDFEQEDDFSREERGGVCFID